MARYTGPVCRLCRRERMKLFLKGTRCMGPKCAIERRPYPPGQHGRGRIKESEYLVQLREKQKARRIYGVLEKQFRRYYEEATRAKGVTGTRLLQLLELRLDNVVYRGGLAMSRDQARQFVTHGHFQVNGRKVDIPSYRVKAGDVVAVRERSRSVGRIVEAAAFAAGRHIPEWLILEAGELKISVVSEPARGVIDVPVQEQMIVELYSK
ncbi:MAG: ribosomal protein [Actinobacteria bacterium]|jgi:small subunit ribosomal protein S4|nr:ribosomal protein [Actinomycetota bacterium]MCW3044971.1 ribosomal protein [Actinomycetota bacterium]MEA2500136.1 small subunit ribosomal protein [Actinomycetota bacterium]MEA2587291.1 small subunit ribosomal protein [Actinomycetota bacterium]MEA2590519.1 small subunit ribosomal protein [Actinomycetota bacterium]